MVVSWWEEDVSNYRPCRFAHKITLNDGDLRQVRKFCQEENWPVFISCLETVSSEKHHQFNTNSRLCRKYIVYLFGGLSRIYV